MQIKETEELGTEVQDTEVEQNDAPVTESNENAKPKEKINFNDLPDEIKQYIDGERTRASKKARARALRDPELLEKAKQMVAEEAELTAEQKFQQLADELAYQKNQLLVEKQLQKSGIDVDEVEGLIDMLVTKDSEKTMENTEKFVTTMQSAIESAIAKQRKANLKDMPTPKNKVPKGKAFKDMNYKERQELKEADPERFKREMSAHSSKL